MRTFAFTRASSLSRLVAAAAATVVAIGLIGAVVHGMGQYGEPLQHFAAAERACAHHRFVSEREDCMRAWMVAQRPDGDERRAAAR